MIGPNISYDIIKEVFLGFSTIVGEIYSLSLLIVPPNKIVPP